MKKMKLAVAFAALVSVFGFSSCLDSDNNGPSYQYDNVTVSNYMGTYLLASDAFPGITYVTDAIDLTPYGITANTKRACIGFTIPEGTDLEQSRIKINLVQDQCFSLATLEAPLSAKHDSLSTYTSNVYALGYYQMQNCNVGALYYPAISAAYGFLNLGFCYAAEKGGKATLEENRIGNDTLYVDLRLSANIKESTSVKNDWRTFDLSKGRLIHNVPSIKNPKGEPIDSIYVTVVANVTGGGSVKRDSLTVEVKKP